MSPVSPRLRRLSHASMCAAMLSACAHPATDVHVETLSMQQALARTQTQWQVQAAPPGSKAAARAGTPPEVSAWLTAPTIALAYIYEWVDAQGNRHLGEWVAMAIQGFDWNLNGQAQRSAPPAPLAQPLAPTPGASESRQP